MSAWVRLRRDGRKRLEGWSRESKDMIVYVDELIDRLPDFDDQASFLAHLEAYTDRLPAHLRDEIRRLVIASLFGATIEEEE